MALGFDRRGQVGRSCGADIATAAPLVSDLALPESLVKLTLSLMDLLTSSVPAVLVNAVRPPMAALPACHWAKAGLFNPSGSTVSHVAVVSLSPGWAVPLLAGGLVEWLLAGAAG